LPDVADRLPGALPDVADGLPGALADVADRLPGALPNVAQRRLRALPDVLRRVAGLVDRFARALADLGDRAAQTLHELGVAIEARHQAIDDRGDVVEARLEHQLGLDALDVELDPAQVHVEAHVELDEVQDPRLEGDVRIEVVELEVDGVDPQLGDVEQNVGRSDAVLLVLVHVLAVLAVRLVDLVPSLLCRALAVRVLVGLLPGRQGPLPVARRRALAPTRAGAL
jgi:hypothetical protein